MALQLSKQARQYRVAEGDTIDVDLLEGDAGQKMTFSDVLMHADGEKLHTAAPRLRAPASLARSGRATQGQEGHRVQAAAAAKVITARVGHRRKLTRVKITGIKLGSKSKKS